MGLEEDLFGSKPIRQFLKMFSEHNWSRLSKATMTIGICRLAELSARPEDGFNQLHLLTVADIEELAKAVLANS